MDTFPIKKISRSDREYPQAFERLHDAPKFFYCRGEASNLTQPSVAVVGTRRASEHALVAARDFSERFVRAGLIVVSGLAFGVDAAAHEGALAGTGRTVAVLGSGVDDGAIYPRANQPLARRILESGGTIISENPPGTKPQDWDFPKRNRLIAALSRATVVVEAPERSGAIITAKYALEVGSDAYVIPADALRESGLGSNRLIVDGAIPLLNPETLIVSIMGKQKELPISIVPANKNEELIVDCLKKGASHADEISLITKIPMSALMASLSALELRGAVASLPGMRYSLALSSSAPRLPKK